MEKEILRLKEVIENLKIENAVMETIKDRIIADRDAKIAELEEQIRICIIEICDKDEYEMALLEDRQKLLNRIYKLEKELKFFKEINQD